MGCIGDSFIPICIIDAAFLATTEQCSRPIDNSIPNIFCVTYSSIKLTGAKAAAEVARRAAIASFILVVLGVWIEIRGLKEWWYRWQGGENRHIRVLIAYS